MAKRKIGAQKQSKRLTEKAESFISRAGTKNWKLGEGFEQLRNLQRNQKQNKKRFGQ